MGYNVTEDIGVAKSGISEFYSTVRSKLMLMTELVEIPERLRHLNKLEDIRIPVMVIGRPGIGKTAGVLSIIRDLNTQLPEDAQIGMKKIMLGQTLIGSLGGIPVVDPSTGIVHKALASELPREEIDGKYGVLFLDEVTTADEQQVQPALGLADDSRSIGEYTLPENWLVVCAGNGPEDANFIRLDNTLLSRCINFDILYDYREDWRPWAHANGIQQNIIAFLNFKPEAIFTMVSTENDRSGKVFPCPRSWTNLSRELDLQELVGRPVKGNLYEFASRIIGVDAAREFAAFARYEDQVEYDVQKILAGTERDPQRLASQEVFHILSQAILGELKLLLAKTVDENENFPHETYVTIANAVRWIIKLDQFMLEHVVSFLFESRNQVPLLSLALLRPEFTPYCPEFDEFIDKYSEAINEVDFDSLI